MTMLVKTFSYVLAASFIVGAGALGWMATDRDLPVDIVESRLTTPTVRPGENMERFIRFVQNRRCYLHSDRAIFDAKGVRHLLPPIEFKAGNLGAVGVEQRYVIQIPIPHEIAFGPARFEASTVYRCNLLHWVWPIYAPYTSIDFTVVPL